jgi:hypothetical protein
VETTTRRRKRKKKAKDRSGGSGKTDATATGPNIGLRHQWWLFLQDHRGEWREFWKIGRHCFVDTVYYAKTFILISQTRCPYR